MLCFRSGWIWYYCDGPLTDSSGRPLGIRPIKIFREPDKRSSLATNRSCSSASGSTSLGGSHALSRTKTGLIDEFSQIVLPPVSLYRYKIRGIRNLIFYGPPDHPQFFTEFLSFPFLDDGVDASDVTCRVLYSKYDFFRMERIAGTKEAVAMVLAI